MRKISFVACLAALTSATALPASAAVITTKSCQNYITLAKNTLPKAVSDPATLEKFRTAVFESRAFSQLDPAIVLKVVGDDQVQEEANNCLNGVEQKGKNFCDANKVKRLKTNTQRGKLRYVNPDRSFKAGVSQPSDMTAAKASSLALDVLIGLGLPKAEISARPFTRALAVAGNDPAGRRPSKGVIAEQHVIVPRIANGLFVFDSEAKLALDAQGQVARLSLQWPDAATTPKLRESVARTPDAIALDVAKQIAESDVGCKGQYSKIRSFIAYAPVDALNSTLEPRTEGEESVNATDNAPRYYAPMLVSYVSPPDPEENSGKISSPGIQFVTPLFEAPVQAETTTTTTGAVNPGNADN